MCLFAKKIITVQYINVFSSHKSICLPRRTLKILNINHDARLEFRKSISGVQKSLRAGGTKENPCGPNACYLWVLLKGGTHFITKKGEKVIDLHFRYCLEYPVIGVIKGHC